MPKFIPQMISDKDIFAFVPHFQCFRFALRMASYLTHVNPWSRDGSLLVRENAYNFPYRCLFRVKQMTVWP